MQVLDLMKNLKEDYKMKDISHYAALAEMFRYPTEELRSNSKEWRKIVGSYDKELMKHLDPFIEQINGKPLNVQQEYYTGTFDVQAACHLDTGYILFGEDFKRAVFLVNIKEEQEKADNDCGTELPDHLTNILTLLPRIKDADLAEELAFSMLIPALNEMITKFNNADNLYKGLLEIVLRIMEYDYPSSTYEKFKIPPAAKACRNEKMPPRMKSSPEYFVLNNTETNE